VTERYSGTLKGETLEILSSKAVLIPEGGAEIVQVNSITQQAGCVN
jgi:hypothetical protein